MSRFYLSENMLEGAFLCTMGHKSVSNSSSGTYSSVNLTLKLDGSCFLPAEVYGGFIHINILKSGCLFVSTISALSFKRMWFPSMMVASLLSTWSLARFISSRRTQSPFYKLLIRVPSINWKMKPPPDSIFCDLFYRSMILVSRTWFSSVTDFFDAFKLWSPWFMHWMNSLI